MIAASGPTASRAVAIAARTRARGGGAGGVAVRRPVEGDDAITRRDEWVDERSELRAPALPSHGRGAPTGPAPHAVARRPSGSGTGVPRAISARSRSGRR